MMKRNTITENACYGCMLCANKCPVKAIECIQDGCGFVFPRINTDNCIGCGKCEKICIANYPPKEEKTIEEAYSSFLINNQDLLRSASGGAAYGLEKAKIYEGGIVYGVAYAMDYRAAEYIRVEKVEDLARLQDTKYFHATEESKRSLFSEVEKDLNDRKSVLVIGLPCEIAALRKTFGSEADLTLVELFCHGVTTVKTHQKYLDHKAGNRTISAFSVKAKTEGWKKNSYIHLKTEDGKIIQEPFYQSAYGYAFAHLSRKSCYTCQFKGRQRVGDISIGDYWGVLKSGNTYNKDGVSVIQVHTERGKELLASCSGFLQISPLSPSEAISDNAWVEKSIPLGDREEYAKRFATEKNIYLPMKVKLKNTIKTVIGRQ